MYLKCSSLNCPWCTLMPNCTDKIRPLNFLLILYWVMTKCLPLISGFSSLLFGRKHHRLGVLTEAVPVFIAGTFLPPLRPPQTWYCSEYRQLRVWLCLGMMWCTAAGIITVVGSALWKITCIELLWCDWLISSCCLILKWLNSCGIPKALLESWTTCVKEVPVIFTQHHFPISCFFFRDVSFFFADAHKPPVAHRDLSSSNVLVRADGTCALCDFGSSAVVHSFSRSHKQSCAIKMSVRVWDATDSVARAPQLKPQRGQLWYTRTATQPQIISPNLQAHAEWGTLRYISPEILQGSVNLKDGSYLLQGDVYALALLLWEIWMRCSDLFPGKLAEVDSWRLLIHAVLLIIDGGK